MRSKTVVAAAELQQKALACIGRQPGLTPERLAVILGMAPYEVDRRGKSRRNWKVKVAIDGLLAQGLIRAELDRFARSGEQPKLYAAAGNPPPRRVLFEPGRVPPLKVWVDPTVKDGG